MVGEGNARKFHVICNNLQNKIDPRLFILILEQFFATYTHQNLYHITQNGL